MPRSSTSPHAEQDAVLHLQQSLRDWVEQEKGDWDALVEGVTADELPGGAQLWDSMPEIDSKAVARTSPIFERHLGVALDISLIRPGGYLGIEDLIHDLIPKMLQILDGDAKQEGRS